MPEWYAGSRQVRSNVGGMRFAHTATVIGEEILILGGYPYRNTHTVLTLNPSAVHMNTGKPNDEEDKL